MWCCRHIRSRLTSPDVRFWAADVGRPGVSLAVGRVCYPGNSGQVSTQHLYEWRERLSERLGGNHYFVNVVANSAFKHAEVETHTCRHDASEPHVTMAFWAGRALDPDVAGHGTCFRHDASLEEAGAQHSQSPAVSLLVGR